MRRALHPQLMQTTAVCANCGASFELRSTVSALRVDVCSNCHPAYTGQTERRAIGSQVERFHRRWGARTTQAQS
jgi:large subunit ribosomal protein L31